MAQWPPTRHYAYSYPGVIDEGETPEQTAIRELEEETGFKADSVIESSPVVVNDPGIALSIHHMRPFVIPPRHDYGKHEAHRPWGHFPRRARVERRQA